MSTRPEGGEPPAKKAMTEAQVELDPLLLDNTDIWVNGILPFLGPGHYIFVALVCRRLRQLYKEYFATLKSIPKVHAAHAQKFQAVHTNTFFRATFSNVAHAEFWYNMKHQDLYFDDGVFERIARYSNLKVMKWAHQKGLSWDAFAPSAAARFGRLDMLKYLHENGCPWHDDTLCNLAAEKGHLECLKYAHSNGCSWNEWMLCGLTAEKGHLEVLKYLHENGGCPWHAGVCAAAAKNGHFDVLKYLHEKGCPWDERTCEGAHTNGHEEIANWAHSQGCPWDSDEESGEE